MSNGRAEAAKYQVAKRRARALELRLQGMTYRQIADEMQCADSTAHELVTAALREIPAAGVELLRREQGETLRLMLLSMWPRIARGEPRAIEVGVRILERHAKLMGLDVPVVKPIEIVTRDAVESAIEQLRREISELEE